MKMARAYDFAPTVVTALAALAVLGYAHFSVIGKGQHIHEPDPSKGVTSVTPAGRGAFVTQYADDRLVKFDPGGHPVWEVSFGKLQESPSVEVLSVATEQLGDILVLGIAPDTKLMALYRVSGQGRDPVVSLVGEYPGLEPSWVAVAPDGSTYLTAYNRRPFLESIADRSKLPGSHIEHPFHELDSQGRIFRSFGSIRHTPKSAQDFGEFLIMTIERQMVFSPEGRAFLVDPDALELEELDLDLGVLTDVRIRLASGAASEQATLNDLFFLNDSTVLYTVARLEQATLDRLGRLVAARPVGWEVRIADLEGSSSLRVASGESPISGKALFFADLDQVAFVEPFSAQVKQRWSRTDLSERLIRWQE